MNAVGRTGIETAETDYIQGPVRLLTRHWRTANPRGSLLLVHGYSEHSARYTHFAQFLMQQGYSVFAFDLPGHGLSGGRRSNIDRFEDYLDCMDLVFAKFKSLSEGPLHLFGHSLGGLISLRFIETSPAAQQFTSAVISSPLLGLHSFAGLPMPAFLLPVVRRVVQLLPNFDIDNGDPIGENVLTHDAESIAARQADPLIRPRVTPHWAREMLRAREEAFADIGRIRLPVGLFQAGDERVVSRPEVERFYSLLAGKKQLKIYDKFFHEIVQEIGKEKVMQEMLSWMQLHESTGK